MNDQSNFDGKNIRFMRELNGLTGKKFAEIMNVTQQSISKWEKNLSIPSPEAFDVFEEKFNFPRQFFFQSHGTLGDGSKPIFFRKRSSIPKKQIEMFKSEVQYYAEIESIISIKLGLPYFKFDELVQDKGEEFKPTDFEDIDDLVEILKAKINIGDAPLGSVTKIVEKMGIRVLFIDFNTPGIDAITTMYKGNYYIGLNTYKLTRVRARLNLLHEVGHIILHSKFKDVELNNSNNYKRIEKEATRFASVFLISNKNFGYEIIVGTTLNRFKSLRDKWGISISAAIYRAKQEEYISSTSYVHLMQEVSRRGWRRLEPGDTEESLERPEYLDSALKFHNVPLDYFYKYMDSKGLMVSKNKIKYSLGIYENTPIMKIVK